jgi:phosphoglycerate dehydrogenase-like enzyme
VQWSSVATPVGDAASVVGLDESAIGFWNRPPTDADAGCVGHGAIGAYFQQTVLQIVKLVIHPAVEDQRLQRIVAAAGPMQVINASDAETAHREIADADAFFGKLTPSLLAASTHLRWVQAPTASLEHYIFPELAEHPCQLTNMRGLFSDVIADQVIGYVLCFARNLHTYIQQQSQRRWAPVGGEAARVGFVTGPGVINEIDRRHLHLADCTLGVVGVGKIGAEVARRANAFGMTVLGVDPLIRSTDDIPDVWPIARLPDLLAVSDFVVIAAPHTPETVKLFRTPQFQQMRRSAYLINIGRGVLVDLADLTAALQQDVIAGAALDVFEIEPLPQDHPLWTLPNVILTPHIAGTSPRIAERHAGVLLDNITRFVNGQPLTNVVDKQVWF